MQARQAVFTLETRQRQMRAELARFRGDSERREASIDVAGKPGQIRGGLDVGPEHARMALIWKKTSPAKFRFHRSGSARTSQRPLDRADSFRRHLTDKFQSNVD